VRTGTPVLTRDGERLGQVEEVLPAHFKVDPSGGGDHYWLAKTSLAEMDDTTAIVSFNADQIEPYKMEQPLAWAADPVLDAASDAFENQEQVDAKRAQMIAGEGPPVADNAGR
jgi:hypothetical protein